MVCNSLIPTRVITRFQAFTATSLRPSHFCDVTLRRQIVGSRCFCTTSGPSMIELIGCSETPVANYQSALPNIPEERWPQDVWRLPDICPVTGNLSVILLTVSWVKTSNHVSICWRYIVFFWNTIRVGPVNRKWITIGLNTRRSVQKQTAGIRVEWK